MKTKSFLLFIVGALFCLAARAENVMTTSDYPINGMGRVILKKHIIEVGGVEKNLLYQDDFQKVPEGAGVDNENTIFVVKYDFELAEDVEIPVGSVLKFEGGSISGEYTITGNNTGIEAGLVKVFGTDVTLDGTWNNPFNVKWFGAKGDGVTDDTFALRAICIKNNCVVKFPAGKYKVTGTIDASPATNSSWVGEEYLRDKFIASDQSITEIYCVGDNNGNPFILFPKYVSNLSVVGESNNNRPAYNNTIGVQIGAAGDFYVDAVYENVAIKYFNTGLHVYCAAAVTFNKTRICNNNNGIDITTPVTTGVNSGYITLLTFNDYVIGYNYNHAIVGDNSDGPPYNAPHTLVFNNGYFENNTLDDDTLYEIHVVGGASFAFNNLYSESTGKFIRMESPVGGLILNNVKISTITDIELNGIDISFNNVEAQNCNVSNMSKSATFINSTIKSYQSLGSDSSNIARTCFINTTITDYNSKKINLVSPYNIVANDLDNLTAPPISANTNNIICFASDIHRIGMYNKGYRGEWLDADGYRLRAKVGATRPTPYQSEVGFQFFDTSIGKPIWWTGTKWILADGSDAPTQ